MLTIHNCFQLFHFFRILSSDLIIFMRIFSYIIQLMCRISRTDLLTNKFPISGTYGLTPAFLMKFPIQKFV